MLEAIRMSNIGKTYRTGEVDFEALKGINLSVAKGSFTAIMGPSGSGKSTLMNIIGLLDGFDEGNYELNGSEVTALSDDGLAMRRNRDIGFVFQSFNLLPKLNLLENVELPLIYAAVSRQERRERALAALKDVGLDAWKAHRPTEISGGQKQRVALARAVVTRPAILLADEPTGNLDSQSSSDIMQLIAQLHENGATVVLITHEAEIAAFAQKIITLRDGRIVEERINVPSPAKKDHAEESIVTIENESSPAAVYQDQVATLDGETP